MSRVCIINKEISKSCEECSILIRTNKHTNSSRRTYNNWSKWGMTSIRPHMLWRAVGIWAKLLLCSWTGKCQLSRNSKLRHTKESMYKIMAIRTRCSTCQMYRVPIHKCSKRMSNLQLSNLQCKQLWKRASEQPSKSNQDSIHHHSSQRTNETWD